MNKTEQELLKTGAVIDFKILNSEVTACVDKTEAYSTASLMMLDEDDNKGYDTVEWGAFGFIYAIANLSFMDSAPRGNSGIDYIEDAYIKLENMMQCMRFEKGTLRFYCDYLYGRLVKTEIIVHQDGKVDIKTVYRGNAIQKWLDQLQGKKSITAVI